MPQRLAETLKCKRAGRGALAASSLLAAGCSLQRIITAPSSSSLTEHEVDANLAVPLLISRVEGDVQRIGDRRHLN